MKLKRYFPFLIMLLLFGACKSKSSISATEPTNNENQSVMSTPTTREKEVIFYTMSSDEIVAYIERTGDDGGVVSIIDDFDLSAGEFQQNPGLPDVTVRFTDAREVVVPYGGKMIKIMRDDQTNLCGAIFTDGIKEPRVLKGVNDVEVYRKVAREFFND